jgi:16S rRNA (uracil1498-N3)-methyltransferase
MQRFFVPTNWLHGPTVLLEDPVANQIRVVLRMRPGARFIVLDNQGWEYEVELIEFGKKQARGKVIKKRPATGEPQTLITVYQCLLKKDNFEWVLQKGTEIGVSRFVPVFSQRTVIADDERVRSHKLPRWERIITEAAEQSRRGRLPALEEPIAFEQAITEAAQADLALIPWEKEASQTLRAAMRPAARVALIIGPEGGLTEDEIALAGRHGVIPVTLGPRILRAETAAIAAALLALYELGDLADVPRGDQAE